MGQQNFEIFDVDSENKGLESSRDVKNRSVSASREEKERGNGSVGKENYCESVNKKSAPVRDESTKVNRTGGFGSARVEKGQVRKGIRVRGKKVDVDWDDDLASENVEKVESCREHNKVEE